MTLKGHEVLVKHDVDLLNTVGPTWQFCYSEQALNSGATKFIGDPYFDQYFVKANNCLAREKWVNYCGINRDGPYFLDITIISIKFCKKFCRSEMSQHYVAARCRILPKVKFMKKSSNSSIYLDSNLNPNYDNQMLCRRKQSF